jgi:hypothetical protein
MVENPVLAEPATATRLVVGDRVVPLSGAAGPAGPDILSHGKA